MPGKGRYFSEMEVDRITSLLFSTDLSIPQIAERMQCSGSAVAALNRKLGVRNYAGRRKDWQTSGRQQHGVPNAGPHNLVNREP
jgi:hypothetical protein